MSNPYLHKLLSPSTINGLELPNRIIKAATFEAMLDQNHNISDTCIDFHKSFAAGGVGMTTLAYCAPEPDGRMLKEYFYIREEVIPQLKKLADSVHQYGSKLSGQIAHCGGFSRNTALQRKRPVAPSSQINLAGIPYGIFCTGAMNKKEMHEVATNYANAARIMKQSGFDAIEIHFGHGYLLSQFISPLTNKRKDEYGGSIENRMRFPLEVLAEIRNAVGPTFPILGKITMFDDVKGGISLEDGLRSAQLLDENGIDALILSAGTSSQNPMLLFHGDSLLKGLLQFEKNPLMRLAMRSVAKSMFRHYPFQENYLLKYAQLFREKVKCKLVYIGGANSPESLSKLMELGFDFVQSGRPLIRDPKMVAHLMEWGMDYKNDCNHCNQCATLMGDPNGIRCVLPQWTNK